MAALAAVGRWESAAATAACVGAAFGGRTAPAGMMLASADASAGGRAAAAEGAAGGGTARGWGGGGGGAASLPRLRTQMPTRQSALRVRGRRMSSRSSMYSGSA